MARTHLTRKVYIHEDGTESRSPKANTVAMRIEFVAPEKDANDQLVVLETRMLKTNGMSPEINHCALYHGYGQKFVDDLAGIANKAKKDGVIADKERGFVDYACQRYDDMFEALAGGVWVAEGQGGAEGNTTILYEAIVNLLTKVGGGEPVADDRLAKIRAALQDDEQVKAFRARPDVAAELSEIKAKRAAERAKAARAAAKGATEEQSLASMF